MHLTAVPPEKFLFHLMIFMDSNEGNIVSFFEVFDIAVGRMIVNTQTGRRNGKRY
jgi:hypothetical protein